MNERAGVYREQAEKAWKRQEIEIGYTDPRAIAQDLAGKLPFEIDPKIIERAFSRMDMNPYMYEGAKDVIHDLLQEGDEVIIWTQGEPMTQLWKTATSGISSIRSELPPSEKKRLGVFTDLHKVTKLPNAVVGKTGAGTVIIVDDKSKNVNKIGQIVELAKNEGTIDPNLQIVPVWINQGRTKDEVPEGCTFEEFTSRFQTISDIRELYRIKAQHPEIVRWLLDFDHTLCNSSKAREEFFGSFSKKLAAFELLRDVPLKDEIGLDGNVTDAFEIKKGMSGSKVVKVTTKDSSYVVKHNTISPEKVAREIRGHKVLKDTPLGARIPQTLFSHEGLGLHVIPHIEGEQVREGMKNGTLPNDLVLGTVTDLLNTKREWWASQEQVYANGDLTSMQRYEWPDTIRRTLSIVESLCQTYGVNKASVWNLPIEHEGVVYQSLYEIMKEIGKSLDEHPAYAVLAHGDATGANIIVDTNTRDWKLIDTEWAGWTDPAEAFVRMVKYRTSATIDMCGKLDLEVNEERLKVNAELHYPPLADEIQAYGLERAHEFAHALHDPDFVIRVKKYLAGSYMREFALAEDRGGIQLALGPLVEAAKALV